MPETKAAHCVPFILKHLHLLQQRFADESWVPPLFIGINGIQGAGKTVLVNFIADALTHPPHNLPTVVLSIDDLYQTRDELARLAQNHPSNPLVQHRGQPSTHDLPLALSIFDLLRRGEETSIPSYDKSAFAGKGDRVLPEEWAVVNQMGEKKIKVVILEGWCVGFRSLPFPELERKWKDAVNQTHSKQYHGRLGLSKLEDLEFVNTALSEYGKLIHLLDALIHIDAADISYVYGWRLEQELDLRRRKGTGMTDEQVKVFIDGYYPSYELYTEPLREGIWNEVQGKQLRLVVDKDRKIKEVQEL